VELGAASGDMLLATQIAERYAIPLPMIVAGMGDDALMREVRTVTRLFDGPPRDVIDVAGMAAVCWSAALSAAVRGFDDEVGLAAQLVEQAVADSPFGKEDQGPLGRYRTLFDGMAALLAGDGPALADAVGRLLAAHHATLEAGMSEEDWIKPRVAPRFVDVAAIALAAQFALRGHHLDVALLPEEAARFGCLLEVQEVEPLEPGEMEQATAQAAAALAAAPAEEEPTEA